MAPAGNEMGDVFGSAVQARDIHGDVYLRAPAGHPDGPVVVGEIPPRPPAFQRRTSLYERLTRADRVSVVHALAGRRGVGKSQLAAAYARACVEDRWDLVAWINAETADQTLAGLTDLAEALGLRDQDDDSVAAAKKARHWLETSASDRCLVVFDNAEDADDLARRIPASGRPHVVITTNRREFENLGTLIDVEVFSDDEALAFLRERTGALYSAGEAGDIAAEVGNLPLPLAQAAAVIRAQHLTHATFLARLRTQSLDDHLRPRPGEHYRLGAVQAVLLAVHAAEDADPLSRPLLELLSVLSPAGVARELLYAAGREKVLTARGIPDAKVDRALECLANASLVSYGPDGGSVGVHRFTQRVVRERAQAEDAMAELVAKGARLLEDNQVPLHRAWPDRDLVRAFDRHVKALWRAAREAGAEATATSLLPLCSWAFRLLQEILELSDAAEAGENLVVESEQVLGPDHPETLTVRVNLADVYETAGRYDDAVALYRRSLADCERILGTDHPKTLVCRNNLAFAYAFRSRTRHLEEAIVLFQETLTDRERVLGPDHPDTMRTRSNLASAYRRAGRLDDAIGLHRRTLADRERVLGSDHPDTFTARNNLGGLLYSVGRGAEAIALLRQALADRERVLGADHPETLKSRNNLARAYLSAGHDDEAIALYEKTLADCVRALGQDHPTTLVVRKNLAIARLGRP